MSASLSADNFPSLANTPQRQWARTRTHKPQPPPGDPYLELAMALARRYPPAEWEIATVATVEANGDLIERIQFRRREK